MNYGTGEGLLTFKGRRSKFIFCVMSRNAWHNLLTLAISTCVALNVGSTSAKDNKSSAKYSSLGNKHLQGKKKNMTS